MGTRAQYSSLTSYSASPVINIVIMILIISGGLGFLTWDDIRTNKLNFKKYRLQSKVILVTTGILILVPAVYFYFLEFSRESWKMSEGERILSSLFQAVTPRTAGFNTAEFTFMRQGSLGVIIILMIIGGSPGSTAGGMKTTTLAVLFSSAVSVFKRREDTQLFGGRTADDAIKRAAALLMMYLLLFITGGIAISCIEGIPLVDCMFETASAIGTVGLTVGITPDLNIASHLILIILMFVGRVGGLTFVFAAYSPKAAGLTRLPLEKINIG